jgi:sulfatase modifying factor 1
MRRLIRWTAPLLLTVSGCSSDQVVLMIHVTNLTPDVTGLQVRAQLDDRPSQQVTFTQRLDSLAVTISKGNIGQGQLRLSLLGVGPSGCSSSGAQYSATVELSSPYLEIDLPLEPLTHRLCKVPKGSFMMGSPATEAGRDSAEAQHMVTLTTDFWMADSEVTQRQYKNLIYDNPSRITGDDLPVDTVSWFQAMMYCNALSEKELLSSCYEVNGATVAGPDGVKCTGYRLPTEAEWEYAARSPATTVFAGSDSVDGVGWYSPNSGSVSHAVKTKTPNGRGLYDLSGNVWEWVWDYYQPNYEILPSIDPLGPPTGSSRVLRGGSFIDGPGSPRVAARGAHLPTVRGGNLGFRIVRTFP